MENGSGQAEGKDPSAFLSEIIGSAVVVKLNSGVVYKGELQSVDGYMNIALEKTEEYVNGVKRRTYGDAFVRGNNGEFERPRGALSRAAPSLTLWRILTFLQSCTSRPTHRRFMFD